MERLNENTQKYTSYPHSDSTARIIGCAIEVHKLLGPGFVEKAYENAMACELRKAHLHFETQKSVNIIYKDTKVAKHRLDFVIEGNVIVELKSTSRFSMEDIKRLLSYLKATKLKVGLLINFSKARIEVRRLVL